MPQGNYENSVRRTDQNAAFDSRYIERAFFIWYKSGRMAYNRIVELLPPDDLGRKPVAQKFQSWRNNFHWEERADIMDAEVSRRVEAKAIEEKVEMLNRHAEAGKAMVAKAVQFIETHDITKMDSAIRMLVQGVQIEQTSRGLPTALLKIAEMDNDSVIALANKLLSDMRPDDAMKMLNDVSEELKSGKDTVEAEFEDSDAH